MPETERDVEILREIARYGFLHAKAIHLAFFSSLTEKACERVITKLLAKKLICAYPLLGAKKYYALTPEAARLLDLSDRQAGKPFAAQGLVTNYAYIRFCLFGEIKFRRLTRPEFEKRFPTLVEKRVLSRAYRTRYYLDHSEASKTAGIVRLSLIVLCVRTSISRSKKKVRREMETRRLAGPAWRAMIDSELFSITVLCASKPKAERLEDVLADEPFPLRVCYVPGLSKFVRLQRGRNQNE
jgi:hypothetical protein